MTPDLTKRDLSESTRQASLDEFSAYLSYTLAYQEADTDIEIEMPVETDFNGTVWVNTTAKALGQRLKMIYESEALGDTVNPVRIERLSHIVITDPQLVDTLYQYVIEENFPNTLPITVFFMEASAAAAIIIPVQVWNDLIAVQVVPMIPSKPLSDPILLKVQELWNEKTKLRQMKNNQNLLNIPEVMRGSDLKKR